MKKHNYSAGPCILPQEVFEEATINIPEKVELEKLEKSIYQLSEEMALDCTIRRMEGTTSRNDRG